MSISAMKQALEALEKLWDIIDDIDTYGDMAKSDDKLYRSLVERRQRQRFEQTGISTDGYELNGGAITALRQAIAEAEKQEPVAWMWKDGTLTSDPDFADGTWTPLFTSPVHARPVVHTVRCTYPQCQATNGCVGACSKTAPVPASDINQEQKTPLKVLGLTVFTENRLRNGRVYDLETLQAMTPRDILAIPDMGKKSLKEVLEALDAYASDMSEKHVHESDKDRHEWVGLDHEQLRNTPIEFNRGALWAERYLKEKNT